MLNYKKKNHSLIKKFIKNKMQYAYTLGHRKTNLGFFFPLHFDSAMESIALILSMSGYEKLLYNFNVIASRKLHKHR